MSTDTVSKDAALKTITAARVVATSGPAVATAEARMKKMNQRILYSSKNTGDAPPVVIPVLPTLTIVTVSVPAEALRVDDTDTHATIVPYSPSEPGDSPPPSSSPTSVHSSHFEGRIPIPRAPSPPPRPQSFSTQAPKETAAERNNYTTDKIPRQDSLKKYTEATMPAIYDTTPYAPLRHMDLDLVDEWEKCPEGKLFAHPFDDGACKVDSHGVKNKIFAAAIEITRSHRVAVSPPRPSKAAIKAGGIPTCFLIYHLTEDEKQFLLERGVWSSHHITFRVTSFYPPCPDFLFSIKGYATTDTDIVRRIVHSVWHDDATETFINSIVEDFPQGKLANASQAISRFIDSMRVKLLPVKESGNILAPRFNVYANGSLITQEATPVPLKLHPTSVAFVIASTTPGGSAPSQTSKDGTGRMAPGGVAPLKAQGLEVHGAQATEVHVNSSLEPKMAVFHLNLTITRYATPFAKPFACNKVRRQYKYASLLPLTVIVMSCDVKCTHESLVPGPTTRLSGTADAAPTKLVAIANWRVFLSNSTTTRSRPVDHHDAMLSAKFLLPTLCP